MMRDRLEAVLIDVFGKDSFRRDDQGVFYFEAVHADVGGVCVRSCGCEVTVEIGSITHGHFDCYEEAPGEAEKEKASARAAAAFLSDLFADRIVLWQSADRSCGGWYYPDEHTGSDSEADRMLYVWTGPARGAT
jgi:hypothetical protein